MRWLTNFYDFRFKSTATAGIGIHPTKAYFNYETLQKIDYYQLGIVILKYVFIKKIKIGLTLPNMYRTLYQPNNQPTNHPTI